MTNRGPKKATQDPLNLCKNKHPFEGNCCIFSFCLMLDDPWPWIWFINLDLQKSTTFPSQAYIGSIATEKTHPSSKPISTSHETSSPSCTCHLNICQMVGGTKPVGWSIEGLVQKDLFHHSGVYTGGEQFLDSDCHRAQPRIRDHGDSASIQHQQCPLSSCFMKGV